MLVVVEDGDVEAILELLLDVEAARRRDVLQVDPAVAGRDPDDCFDEFVDRARLHHDGHGIDVSEVLEEDRLPLHHRHRTQRADVAQAQDCGSITDDGHGVAARRVAKGQGRVGGDRQRHLGHARCVEQRQIRTIPQRLGGVYAEFAALVRPEDRALRVESKLLGRGGHGRTPGRDR